MSSLSAADTAPPDSLRPSDAVAVGRDSTDGRSKTSGVDENGVPLLSTFAAEDEDTRVEALHIIADSVAQQRNIASRSLIFHPLSLAAFIGLTAVLYRCFYDSATTDWIKVAMTMTGVIMALLGAVRLLCGPYIFEAERVGTWKWLNQGRSTEEEEQTDLRVLAIQDEMLITKFGDEFIGAIIFRGVQPIAPSSPNGPKRSRRTSPSSSKQTRTIIRAWSVKQKYRRKEVGSALLEDALKIARSKGWTTDGVEFAEDHANHKRILPAIFNGPLDQFVSIAHRTLDKKVQELGLLQDKGRRRK